MTPATGRPTKGPPLAERIAPEVAELVAAGHGRNEIARRLEVSPSTVSTAAKRAGVTFDGAATEAATRVRVAQAADTRAELAGLSSELALTAGRRLLVEVSAPVLDPATVRALATAYGVSTDKLTALLAVIPDGSEADSRQALDDLIGAIRQSADADRQAVLNGTAQPVEGIPPSYYTDPPTAHR